MPKVPSNSYLNASPTVPNPRPRPSDANLLMAAAVMDAQGRLTPKPSPTNEPTNGPTPTSR